jgi:hypothetical protein
MPKFRKKPVEIEAIQFNDSTERIMDVQNFMNDSLIISYKDKSNPKLILSGDDENELSASVGDWVIRTSDGDFYPMSDETFKKYYEPVN